MKSPLFLLLTALLITTLSCADSNTGDPTPPTIYYGEDVCEFCGMIISDERFAGGYLTDDGQSHIFDDIGDMVLQYQREAKEITAVFVHDYHQHRWLRAETAFYTLSPNIPTPMLSGIIAFQTQTEAQAAATEFNGQVLTFDELLTYYRNNPPTPFRGF